MRTLVVVIALVETLLWLVWALPALDGSGEGLAVFFRRFFAIIVTVPFVLCTLPAWGLALSNRRLEWALGFEVLAVPVGFATLWIVSR